MAIPRPKKIVSTHSLLHIYTQHGSSRNCVFSGTIYSES
jgi:hypothetical protein